MRNLYRFIVRNNFVILFLILEGVSFLFIFQFNKFQKSHFIEHSRNVTSFIYNNFHGFNEYFNLRVENDMLSLENVRLKNLIEKHNYEKTGEVSIYDSVKRVNYVYTPARVIYNSVNKQYNYITVNKGKLQGVYPEMAVISAKGVVGIVIGTSNNFATVLPVLNRNFRVSAKIKRNNYFGIIEWDGVSSEYVTLKEIPVHVSITPGDTIVTSGYSTIFPEGIDIGIVAETSPAQGNFHEVKVKLLPDYNNLVHVILVKYNLKEEQEKLENSLGL